MSLPKVNKDFVEFVICKTKKSKELLFDEVVNTINLYFQENPRFKDLKKEMIEIWYFNILRYGEREDELAEIILLQLYKLNKFDY